MLQQVIAILIILFFVSRLFWQKKKNHVSSNEFLFWLIFWFIAGLAIVFLKKIDIIVKDFGFSGSGIDVLIYLSVLILFYYIFKLRLRLSKVEKDITKIVSSIAINNARDNNEKK